MKTQAKGILKKTAFLSVITLVLLSCSYDKNFVKETDMGKEKNKSSWQDDTSPITFDWYINYSWFTTAWGNNEVSKYVTEKTGVSINFMTPKGDEAENLRTMLDKGRLPDFITLSAWDDGYKNIIKSGLALSLDELSELYDPYFFKVADMQKLEWYRQSDGHVYCYPNYSLPIEDYENYKEDRKPSNQTFLVRKDIYETLGKPDMRTPEGFLKALEEAKNRFPMVGEESLIPLGMHEFTKSGNLSIDSILPNFLAVPYEKDGKLYDRYTDPELIRWLKTLRKANELGLLAENIFYESRAQIEENIIKGRYFAMIYQRSDLEVQQLALYAKDKNKIYIPVDGPANSNLDQPTLAGDSISGWTVTLISKNCKDPERAIKFLSYLISEEGNKDLYLGKQGATWDIIDGKEQFVPEVQQLLERDKIAFDNKYGAGETYWMLMDTNYIQKWAVPKPEALKVLQDWPKGKTYNFSVYDQTNPYGESEEAIIFSKVNTKWQETLKLLLLAKDDEEFDKIFNQYEEYAENHGNEKVIQYKQRKFEENKKKLGIK
ncbi:extracellular solute-binding protein [Clostridium thermarum]|uniref:extracellular solute-binding protein n=1 Tax=Clostridium thermarum TaxID=1716543 RepID=UPI00111F29A4|nr:extracellular solute-binding protein [Clostridium thermarum]